MMPSRLVARPGVSETKTARDRGVGWGSSTVPVLHQLAESFSRRPACVVGADGEIDCLALVDVAKGYLRVIILIFVVIFVVQSKFVSSDIGDTSSDLWVERGRHVHLEFQVDEPTTIGEGLRELECHNALRDGWLDKALSGGVHHGPPTTAVGFKSATKFDKGPICKGF